MGRTLGYVFLFAALSACALSQSTTTSTPTTVLTQTSPSAQPTSGALPLPAPPQAALPGSGTPVGTAPSLDVNNAAAGGQGVVVQPGVNDMRVGGQYVVAEPRQITTPSAAPENASAAQQTAPTPASQVIAPPAPARYGLQYGNVAPQKSLGEVSAQLKAKKLSKRSFDNSDIAALNDRAPNGLRTASDDLPQGDQPVVASPQNPADKNRALDPNDLRKVEDAVKKSQENPDANRPK
jgi:hypothetical protein